MLDTDAGPVLSLAMERRNRGKRLLGLALLLSVVVIWTASSEAIQYIFEDTNFSKPFFLTYLSTSLFSLYLVGFLFRADWVVAPRWRSFRDTLRGTAHYKPLEAAEDRSRADSPALADYEAAAAAAVVSSSSSASPSLSASLPRHLHPEATLDGLATLRLAALFCPFWFAANLQFNISLSMTSVSSNTILSSTSGLFTFGLSLLFLGERFRFSKLLAVALSLGGVICITLTDEKVRARQRHASPSAAPEEARHDHALVGDALALGGALAYAMYSVLLKCRITEQVSMPMFFGCVGLVNTVVLWPLFFVLDATKLEPFEAPRGKTLYALLINGLVGTVLSDILWALSVVLTTPLTSTVGLALTIPAAIIADSVMGKISFNQPLYILGSLLVTSGFLTSAFGEKYF
jgi:solute carrier family 35 protein F5